MYLQNHHQQWYLYHQTITSSVAPISKQTQQMITQKQLMCLWYYRHFTDGSVLYKKIPGLVKLAHSRQKYCLLFRFHLTYFSPLTYHITGTRKPCVLIFLCHYFHSVICFYKPLYTTFCVGSSICMIFEHTWCAYLHLTPSLAALISMNNCFSLCICC